MSPSTPSGGWSTGRASVPGTTGRAAVPGSADSYADPWARGTAATSLPPGGPGAPAGPRRGRRPRWGRILLVFGLAVALMCGATSLGLIAYTNSLDNRTKKTDPFSQIVGDRPVKTVDGALNVLVLGSDSRDPDNKAKAGEWRTDTMIFMHVPASHDKAYMIALPRDLYVYIPQSQTDPSLGDTKAKINAAFAWGGLPLAIQTVEGFTGVRVDHVVLIDFGGFKQVVDALGGVDMNVEQDVTSIHPPHRTFKKGMNHFDGNEALDYCRQRYQFPDGDFARMRHQQQFLKALLDKASSGGTLTNPKRLNDFLQSVTGALTVDKDFSIVDMAIQFRNIRSSDLTFLVSPHLGAQDIDGESVIAPDKDKGAALYDAVAKDTVDQWVAANPLPSPKAGG